MKKICLVIALLLVLLVGACFIFGKVFGWPGVLGIVAIFIVICLFEFYRSMRLMSAIQTAPEGKTAHAEFLYHHISVGMSIIKIIQIAQALGEKTSAEPDVYIWQDGYRQVSVTVENKKATQIEITPLEGQEPQSPQDTKEVGL